MKAPQGRSLEDRFWERVNKTDTCWLWTAGTNPRGYGMLRKPKALRMSTAHRVSWEIHFGEIPHGLWVLHKCDTPRCVNPAHLFLGTVSDNNQDRHTKGRSRGGSSPGEKSPHAKLVESQVLEIRTRRAAGARYHELAADFGITRESVRDIVLRRNWKHVP